MGLAPSGPAQALFKIALGNFVCLGSPLSAIHGVQTLPFTLRFADFSGDTTPRCETADKSYTGVAVGSLL
jgi:hypothetical protein